MNKILVLIIIVFLIFLAGCSAENNKITSDNDIQKETIEHTTLSAPVNQEYDLVENHEMIEIKNISDNVKISYFDEKISTNRNADGSDYDAKQAINILPVGIAPVGFPNDILSSDLKYSYLADDHYWYNFRYANPKAKRYVFFQATNANDFIGIDDVFIMSLEKSFINENTVYIASYPNDDFDAECFLAYYGKFGYRCIIESINLSQEEFINLLISSL